MSDALNVPPLAITSEQLNSALADAVDEERTRICALLQNAAKMQAMAGDIDGAQIITEAVRLIEHDAGDGKMLLEVMPVGDPEPEAELPPARERSDDEVMASMLRRNPPGVSYG